MIQRRKAPTSHGHFDENQRISFRKIEKRLDEIAKLELVPIMVLCAIATDIGQHEALCLGDVENALEAKIQASPGIPAEMWAKVCEILCPELYGEPPNPTRPSEAFPATRAMMAALQRRYEAGKGLRNYRDTSGLPKDRIPKYLWTQRMRRSAKAKADVPVQPEPQGASLLRLELCPKQIRRDFSADFKMGRKQQAYSQIRKKIEAEVEEGVRRVVDDLAKG